MEKIDLLKKALEDPSSAVREAAVLSSSSFVISSKDISSKLLKIVKNDSNVYVVMAAAEILQKDLDNKNLMEALFLKYKCHFDVNIRKRAVALLFGLHLSKKRKKEVEELFQEDQIEVGFSCLEIILSYNENLFFSKVRELWEENHSWAWKRKELFPFLKGCDCWLDSLKDLIEKDMLSSSQEFREAVLGLVGCLSKYEDRLTLWQLFLKDESADVRMSTVRVLGNFWGIERKPEVFEMLKNFYFQATTEDEKIAVIHILAAEDLEWAGELYEKEDNGFIREAIISYC